MGDVAKRESSTSWASLAEGLYSQGISGDPTRRSLAHLRARRRISVFVADMNYFETMNQVYARIVLEPRALRTTIQAGLSSGFRVEIDAVAVAE